MLNANSHKLLNVKSFSNFLNSLNCIKQNSTVAVAVSSGVDSMTLLHLSNVWAKKNKKKLFIITFDHNLRKEAKNESSFVKKYSAQLGWPHKILKWNKPAEKNILANARIARYLSISKFCKKKNIDSLLLAHHLDDMIETFCMRILKKTRFDGLCPMVHHRKLFELNLIRPFLQISKESIYDYANLNNIKFFEDPTNRNNKFIRTKIRIFLEANQNLKYKLSKSLSLFCKIKKYFDYQTHSFFMSNIRFEKEGYIKINKKKLIMLPEFLNLRVLNKVIMNLGHNTYPLRSKTLLRISKILLKDDFSVISAGGCLIANYKPYILIIREYNKIKSLKLTIPHGKQAIWDNKLIITNLSNNFKISITPLGKELTNKSFIDFYNSKKKYSKKLPFIIKKTLPVIKTLEGLIYIPHLNIYNDKNDINLISLENIDYCNFYN